MAELKSRKKYEITMKKTGVTQIWCGAEILSYFGNRVKANNALNGRNPLITIVAR